MSWLYVDNAVGAALAGRDPREILPSTADMGGAGRGFPSAVYDSRVEGPAKIGTKIGERQVSYGGIKTTIPIIHFRHRGRRVVDIYPSVTYQLLTAEFNPKRYVWKGDRFSDPIVSSNVEVMLNDQKGVRGMPASASPRTTLVGPSLRKVRDNPEPFTLMFEIGLWASDHNEHHMLQRLLMEVFPPRGCLTSVQADGTLHSWDMNLESENDVDDDESTLEDQERKRFGVVYTYAVETFRDNTLDTTVKRTFTGGEPDLHLHNK
jgi:hypothetical protein